MSTSSTYTTTQGDTWDSIAFRLWGDERHLDVLLTANPDHADVLIFPAGVALRLPQVPARRMSQKELPPWLR